MKISYSTATAYGKVTQKSKLPHPWTRKGQLPHETTYCKVIFSSTLHTGRLVNSIYIREGQFFLNCIEKNRLLQQLHRARSLSKTSQEKVSFHCNSYKKNSFYSNCSWECQHASGEVRGSRLLHHGSTEYNLSDSQWAYISYTTKKNIPTTWYGYFLNSMNMPKMQKMLDLSILFDYLFDYRFTSRLRLFRSWIWRGHNCSAPTAIEQGEIFIVTRGLGFFGLNRRTTHVWSLFATSKKHWWPILIRMSLIFFKQKHIVVTLSSLVIKGLQVCSSP